MSNPDPARPEKARAPRFSDDMLLTAARLYYLEDATQAQVAKALGTSRPTVSRVLAEARARGIVQIRVFDPRPNEVERIAARLREVLRLDRVWVGDRVYEQPVGRALGPLVAQALEEASLGADDVLLVSSGISVYDAAQVDLPQLPGVLVAPCVGGIDEPEAHYQTNEITRMMAAQVGGVPHFLYAPALPRPELAEALLAEPTIRRILGFWERADCALMGVGAPPGVRTSMPSILPSDDPEFRATAVGDIATRPYDADGEPVVFPGIERLLAISLEQLRRIPTCIAIAAGPEKVPSISAGARAGYFNQLVTDIDTATGILTHHEPPGGPQ